MAARAERKQRRLRHLITEARSECHELLSILRCPELAPRGKVSLVAAKIRYRAGRLKRDAVVDCRVTRIRFGRESFPVDWYVFEEIFVKRIYDGLGFERASVLDLGAHKGYFAVYAFCHGAEEVVSFEPEPANFQRLAVTAKGVPGWTVRREAVAGEAGTRTLLIRQAWSHSLQADGDSGGGVRVPVVALADILGASGAKHRLVKVDIEGAEYEALGRVPTDSLARIDELVVEAHPHARWGAIDIVALAEAAGLRGTHLDLSHPSPLLRFTTSAALSAGGDRFTTGA